MENEITAIFDIIVIVAVVFFVFVLFGTHLQSLMRESLGIQGCVWDNECTKDTIRDLRYCQQEKQELEKKLEELKEQMPEEE